MAGNHPLNQSDGLIIPDADERTLVLDPSQSFAVSAPAGSGKTELLTQRVLKLLAHVQEPEEILAITFTRKAAREMQDRIIQALLMARTEPAPDQPHRKRTWMLARAALKQNDKSSWSLLENSHRLAVKTIDSLGMQLAQRLPLLTGLGTNAIIDEQPEKLYQLAIRRLLERLEFDPGISHDLQVLLRHLDNNTERVEALLTKILSNREQWLRHVVGSQGALSGFKAYLESCLDTLVTETLGKTRAQCQPYSLELLECLKVAATNLKKTAPNSALVRCADLSELPGTKADDLNLWLGVVELLTTKSGAWRARLTKAEGFPPAPTSAEKTVYQQAKKNCQDLIERLRDHPYLLDSLAECRALPSPFYNDEQWRLLGALTRLLPNLVAELLVIFSEHGSVDYPQITMSADAALGSEDAPSDIALLMDHKISHILIDEFQDTSSSQFSLLERLTDGWQAGDGRSLFIVGDGMQSCYGFRDANVGLFLAARKQGIGNAQLLPVDLKVNFRSEAGVVNWVNQTFENAFPQDDDISRGAVSYNPSIAHSSRPDNQNAVKVIACIEDQQRLTEARQVAELVKSVQAENHQDSIAILVRNRNHLREIIPALQALGIQWLAVDIDPLIKRPVISDLLALTRALLNLADRTAWLAILRAPWCGLSLGDLHRLVGNNRIAGQSNQRTVWQTLLDTGNTIKLSDAGQLSLKRLLSVLAPALKQKHRKPLRQWLEGIWLTLGGPACGTAEELIHANSYFDLLEAHDCGGTLRNVPAFIEIVEGLYAKPAVNPAINVQIMTIHKAKGLEFDHVIIPGLDRTGRSDSHALLLWHERLSNQGIPQLLIGPITAKGADEDILYKYLKGEHAIKQNLENTRLLYVAATRAIKRLYLFACVRKDPETNKLVAPSKNSLVFSIWEAVKDQVELIDPAPEPASTASTVSSQITRLKANWQCPELPHSSLLSQFRGHEYPDANVEEMLQPWPSQKDFNQQLKRIYVDMLSLYQQQGGSKVLPVPAMCLADCGDDQTTGSMIRQIDLLVKNTLADKHGRWLLGLDTKNETELSARHFNSKINTHDNGQTRLIDIPLTFVCNDNIWLIDFDFDCQSRGQFEQQESDIMAGHQAKLHSWIKAHKSLADKPVKAAVYFPLLKHLKYYVS